MRIISVPIDRGSLPNIGEAVSKELNDYEPGRVKVIAVVPKLFRQTEWLLDCIAVDLILEVK